MQDRKGKDRSAEPNEDGSEGIKPEGKKHRTGRGETQRRKNECRKVQDRERKSPEDYKGLLIKEGLWQA